MPYRRALIRGFRYVVSFGRPGPDVSWITHLLAVSGTLHPRHIADLAEREVRAILDLREEDRDDPVLLARRGIHFLHLPVRDHCPPSQEQLVEGTRWVLNELRADRRTLVHCKVGIGRSVVLVCCVLMMEGYMLGQALSLVGSKRWGVALNARQKRALVEFEQRIIGERPERPGWAVRHAHQDARLS